MNSKPTQIITLLILTTLASAQQHYKAVRISTFPNETIGLSQKGPYVLSNTQGGTTLAALVANSNGEFAGQDQNYQPYTGSASGITGIASLVESYAQIWAINDNGTMVGYSNSPDSSAFEISNGTVTSIPTLGGTINAAQAVSTNDLVVGQSWKGDGLIDGFLWDGSKVVDLGNLGGSHYFANTNRTFQSDAWGVNSSREVVGSSWLPNGQQRAFLWKDGKMISLGTLGGTQSWATGINDHGVVLGGSTLPNGLNHAFVYEESRRYDLDSLVSGLKGGAYIDYASQINNSGQILATGSDGQTYLLEPID